MEVQNLFCAVAEAAGERRSLDEGTGRHFFNEFIKGFSIAGEGVTEANKTDDDSPNMNAEVKDFIDRAFTADEVISPGDRAKGIDGDSGRGDFVASLDDAEEGGQSLVDDKEVMHGCEPHVEFFGTYTEGDKNRSVYVEIPEKDGTFHDSTADIAAETEGLNMERAVGNKIAPENAKSSGEILNTEWTIAALSGDDGFGKSANAASLDLKCLSPASDGRWGEADEAPSVFKENEMSGTVAEGEINSAEEGLAEKKALSKDGNILFEEAADACRNINSMEDDPEESLVAAVHGKPEKASDGAGRQIFSGTEEEKGLSKDIPPDTEDVAGDGGNAGQSDSDNSNGMGRGLFLSKSAGNDVESVKSAGVETFRLSRPSIMEEQGRLEKIELVKFAANGREGEVKMDLNHPSMGRLQVELNINGDAVKAVFHTDTQAVKAALEGSMQDLKDAFSEQELELENFDVRSDGDGKGRSYREGEGPFDPLEGSLGERGDGSEYLHEADKEIGLSMNLEGLDIFV